MSERLVETRDAILRLQEENARLRSRLAEVQHVLGRLCSTTFGEEEGDLPKYESWSEALGPCLAALEKP